MIKNSFYKEIEENLYFCSKEGEKIWKVVIVKVVCLQEIVKISRKLGG